MNKRYKIRKKNKFNMKVIIIIFIAILLLMSTAYSLLSTKLTIIGNVVGEYSAPILDIVVPEPETDENGVTRYTTNTEFTYWNTEIFRIVSETYEEGTITTTLKYIRNQLLSTSYVTGTITLSIQNGTNSTFTNGTMEIEEIYDPNTAFQSNTYSVGSVTLESGETGEPQISVTLAGKSITDGTMCKYRISYEVDGVTKYFYYILILQPYTTS